MITNTKGFTGHAMGAGIEDVVAIKALETGVVPPVPNYKEPDPELGDLNLSQGGSYPVDYALAAGRRLRLADRDVAAALDPDAGRAAPRTQRARIRLPDRRPAGLAALARRHQRPPRGPARDRQPAGCGSSDDGPASDGPGRGTRARPAQYPAVPPPAVAVAPPAGAGCRAAAAPGRASRLPPRRWLPSRWLRSRWRPADEVTDAVVGIVSEMTGYPRELLDLDLDLEADLGVDTVKQAEVFAAVRARFGVERDDNLALREFPTLAHVIGWIRDKTGIAAPATAPPAAAAASRCCPSRLPRRRRCRRPSRGCAAGGCGAGGGRRRGDRRGGGIVSEMTGYPPELLDLDLDLEADLGVDTVKQAEVFAAVRARFGVERDDNLALREFPTLAHVIGWIRDKTGIAAPAAAPPAAAAASASCAAGCRPAGRCRSRSLRSRLLRRRWRRPTR